MLRKVEDVRRARLAVAVAVETHEDVREQAPFFRDFVAGPWKAACYDRCKPSTQRNRRSILKDRWNRVPAGGVSRPNLLELDNAGIDPAA